MVAAHVAQAPFCEVFVSPAMSMTLCMGMPCTCVAKNFVCNALLPVALYGICVWSIPVWSTSVLFMSLALIRASISRRTMCKAHRSSFDVCVRRFC